MDDNPPADNSGWPLWGKVTASLAALGVIAGGIENADKIWKKINDLCCVDNVPPRRIHNGEVIAFSLTSQIFRRRFASGRLGCRLKTPKLATYPATNLLRYLKLLFLL
jgi:hypothetical protein